MYVQLERLQAALLMVNRSRRTHVQKCHYGGPADRCLTAESQVQSHVSVVIWGRKSREVSDRRTKNSIYLSPWVRMIF